MNQNRRRKSCSAAPARPGAAVLHLSSAALTMPQKSTSSEPQLSFEENFANFLESVQDYSDPCWGFYVSQPLSRHRRAPSETEGYEEEVQQIREDVRVVGFNLNCNLFAGISTVEITRKPRARRSREDLRKMSGGSVKIIVIARISINGSLRSTFV